MRYVKLNIEQRAALIEIYPKVKTGASDSVQTTASMVRLYNEVYGTRYKEGTSCTSCLSGILKTLINLYEENTD